MSKEFGQSSETDHTLGAEAITDSATHTGRSRHIDFYGNNLNGETMPAGFHLVGVFTSSKLQNGACIAYHV